MQIQGDFKTDLEKLMELVLEKNKVINLTSITNPDDFWQKHILDSLEIFKTDTLRELCGKKNLRIADVGSGAGFPGLPIALCFSYLMQAPEIVKNILKINEIDVSLLNVPDFVLVDATKKKVDAINDFISKLNLSGVEAIWGRSEELALNNGLNSSFDLVTARSVAFLPKLIDFSRGLVKKGGYLAVYKLDNDDELHLAKAALMNNNLKLAEKYSYILEGSKTKRAIYLFRK